MELYLAVVIQFSLYWTSLHQNVISLQDLMIFLSLWVFQSLTCFKLAELRFVLPTTDVNMKDTPRFGPPT